MRLWNEICVTRANHRSSQYQPQALPLGTAAIGQMAGTGNPSNSQFPSNQRFQQPQNPQQAAPTGRQRPLVAPNPMMQQQPMPWHLMSGQPMPAQMPGVMHPGMGIPGMPGMPTQGMAGMPMGMPMAGFPPTMLQHMMMGGMGINPFAIPLRRGKWTQEEEVYVEKIIQCFNDGTLQAPPGVTLRAFLR